MSHHRFAGFLSLMAAVACVATGCAPSASPTTAVVPSSADSAMYVVRLGRDTSYLQWVVRRGHDVRMEVVERLPRVRVLRTTLTQNPDGSIARLERLAYLPTTADTAHVERIVITTSGDSTITEVGPRSPRRMASRGRAHIHNTGLLMVSYPLIAPYAPRRVGDSVVAQQFSTLGDRTLIIKRVSPDTFTLASTLMGRVRVHVDAQGRSAGFDGLGSSVNLQGERVPWTSPDSVIARLVAHERTAGAGGAIAPRDTARAAISGATILIDYGRPSKRGRVIFGGIVPYGVVWRTGANLATHIVTDRALRLGETTIPAGRYTLWTIPDRNSWTLIVSSRTGQWGTDYAPGADIARVPMQVSTIDPVERFTIVIEPDARGGMLRLLWDTTQASIPFTIP